MTYIAKRRSGAKTRKWPRAVGLAGVFDDILHTITGRSEEQGCVDQANQEMAPFDAKIDDLVRTWNPTGFYTSKEIRDLVSSTMLVVARAQGALDSAAAEPNASRSSVMNAVDDLARAGARSLDYLAAANTADQQGLRLVNAVGMKRWVTDTLASASAAMVTASTIGCLRPWWVSAIAAFQPAFDSVWSLARGIVGAALAIGETALKVAGDLPQLYDVLKWGALAVGAYMVADHIRRGGHAL